MKPRAKLQIPRSQVAVIRRPNSSSCITEWMIPGKHYRIFCRYCSSTNMWSSWQIFLFVICSILSRGTSDFFEHSDPSFIQQDVEDISYTKRTRIYRGIYRLMIYGNLFRYDQTISGHNRADWFDTLDQSHPFLRPFPAWQVEELSCVNYFIYDKITESGGKSRAISTTFLKTTHPI